MPDLKIVRDGFPIYSPTASRSGGSVPPSGEITAQLGVGPWTQIGECSPGHPLSASGYTYTIARATARGNFLEVSFKRNRSGVDYMSLTAVCTDGREAAIYPLNPTAISPKSVVQSVQFEGLTAGDISSYHVWLRKAATVTFTDFAQAPNVEPPQTVTREEVLAAVAATRPSHQP